MAIAPNNLGNNLKGIHVVALVILSVVLLVLHFVTTAVTEAPHGVLGSRENGGQNN